MAKTIEDQLGMTQWEWIDMMRQMTGVSQVIQQKLPRWLPPRLRKWVRDHPTPRLYNRREWNLLMHVAGGIENCNSDCEFLDHWGKSRHHDGRWLFVSEPYGWNNTAAAAFAEALELKYRWCAASWHYPARTMRVIFWPKHWSELLGIW